MHVCERQAGTRSMYIQYSYNSNISILLVSLLSRVSGSLRTTPFHFFKKCFYTCIEHFHHVIRVKWAPFWCTAGAHVEM